MKHGECKTYPAGVGRDGIIELGVSQILDVQVPHSERVSGAIVIAGSVMVMSVSIILGNK